jgi:arsenite methyltransferase
MTNEDSIKTAIKQKYGEIALQEKEQNLSSCCGASGCSTEVTTIMADDYSQFEGYNPDADLGLGCGLPTQFARIKKGDVVVDLGSGAGNDAFIARHETGDKGKVIGVDFTPAMIQRARQNAALRGFTNVEFREGDIENMPVAGNSADVIISNCVLNLVPAKMRVFKEIYRVLKPGGHFSISDVVLEGELPDEIKQAAEMYAGCVAGAIQQKAYMNVIEETGFLNVTHQKEKVILIPDDILKQYLSNVQIAAFKDAGTTIKSITVYAEKPTEENSSCCGPGCCNK